jgi:hypothetical protein
VGRLANRSLDTASLDSVSREFLNQYEDTFILVLLAQVLVVVPLPQRSPGEKTAFEVQTLDTYASRIFQEKISQFERLFLEPILNLMLESARRNITGNDVIQVMDTDLGAKTFVTVTRKDISANGKLRPVGSRHFAATQQLMQSIMQALNSPLGNDPTVMSHVSGKKLAHLVFEELPGLRKFALVQDNVRLFETAEIQRLSQTLQENVEVEGQLPVPGQEVPE